MRRRNLPSPKGGKILYTTRQSIAMTVGADTVTIIVPKGKRWLVYDVWLRNNSGQIISCWITRLDDANNVMGFLDSKTLADTAEMFVPNTSLAVGDAYVAESVYPLLLESGMKLVFTWGALAGKAGTSYWFAMIEEFTA